MCPFCNRHRHTHTGLIWTAFVYKTKEARRKVPEVCSGRQKIKHWKLNPCCWVPGVSCVHKAGASLQALGEAIKTRLWTSPAWTPGGIWLSWKCWSIKLSSYKEDENMQWSNALASSSQWPQLILGVFLISTNERNESCRRRTPLHGWAIVPETSDFVIGLELLKHNFPEFQAKGFAKETISSGSNIVNFICAINFPTREIPQQQEPAEQLPWTQLREGLQNLLAVFLPECRDVIKRLLPLSAVSVWFPTVACLQMWFLSNTTCAWSAW